MSRYFDNKELFVGPTTKQYGSHMVTTNVIKETKIKYITIDSRFKDEYNNSNLANYFFTLPEKINDVKSIYVSNVEIPMSIYNISQDLGNNYFSIYKPDANGNPMNDISMVSIPSGFYFLNPYYATNNGGTTVYNDLETYINTAIENVSDGSLSVDFSNNYNNGSSVVNTYNGYNTVFTNNSNSPMVINFAVTPTGTFDKKNTKAKLGWLMGFHNTQYNIPARGKIFSDSFINLNNLRYMYLIVDEFTGQKQNSFTAPLPNSIINKNILAKIPISYVTYQFGDILIGNQTNGFLLSDKRSYNGKTDIHRLNVQLVNEFGTVMNLNGLDFSFTLTVEYE
jgi:hypothetical protein